QVGDLIEPLRRVEDAAVGDAEGVHGMRSHGSYRKKLFGLRETRYNAGMTQEAFEQTLRELMRRRPFQPFIVELVSGDRFEVDAPESVAWNGGTAGYLRPSGEPILFHCKDVSQIITQTAEATS